MADAGRATNEKTTTRDTSACTNGATKTSGGGTTTARSGRSTGAKTSGGRASSTKTSGGKASSARGTSGARTSGATKTSETMTGRRAATGEGNGVSVPVPVLTPHMKVLHVPAPGMSYVGDAGRLIAGYLPPPDRLMFYGGLGIAAVLGAIDWPVAAAIGVGTMIARRGRGMGMGRMGRMGGAGGAGGAGRTAGTSGAGRS
jgi:hypothetical protein